MAHLFKNKKIKEELENYEIPDFEEKMAKVKAWHDSYKNKSLHTKTESQCEQAFNQDFFIEILGYVSFPNETYTIDPKGTADASSQKADAVLGYFSEDKKRVTAAVEIKDVNTSLDKSQQRAGNLSPIQQAFKYKPQYKDCAFVIATNFFEIRLFRDNQLDYESFTLETLTNSKDNYYEFRKFYYLLNAKNFVIKHGKSVTEKLLSDIRIEQEKITKDFYRDYKELRQRLISNLVKNNKELDFNTIVEKAQKIIDRLVFICFCEDLDLLPENKLQEVVFHTDKMGLAIPIWDIMKGFFIAIDKGSKKLEIPDGYNGELFKEDNMLNNLRIDDEICKKFIDLGKYDFSEDLSVNILGHIFEQSISDIEILKSSVEQNEIDNKKSKRKKDGIFYTPDYIVDYIVNNALGAYLEEKEKEIMKKHGLKKDIKGENYQKRALEAYHEYQDTLRNIKVLDPACGSGAFLVKVFDYLLAENKRVADIITELSGGNKELFSDEGYIKDLLENNIYGVDLNPESVEITKLSLWLKTAVRGKKLVNLKKNIKCGNSLIDDPEFAKNRAFNWEKEFSEIMQKGGFDVIVGNPPYVRQELLSPYKPYFQKKYKCYSGTSDLFAYFYEQGLNLLKKKGYMSFISNSFARTTGAGEVLRQYLQNNVNFVQLVDFGTIQIFEGATTYPVIFVFNKKEISKNFNYLSVKPEDLSSLEVATSNHSILVSQKQLDPSSWTFEGEEAVKLRQKLKNHQTIKEKYGKCYRGILTGFNEAFIIDDKKRKDLIKVDSNSKELIKPFWEGKDISKWTSSHNSKFIILIEKGWTHEKVGEIEKNMAFSKLKQLLPGIASHLEQYEKKCKKRYDKGDYWWELRACDYYSDFEKEKITWPNLQNSNKFCWDDKGHYVNAPAVILPTSDKYLLSILNSKLIWFFLTGICVTRSGGYIEVKPQYFQQIPIPNVSEKQKSFLTENANTMIDLHLQIQNRINRFKQLLQEELNLETWSQKLKEFWKLPFEEFIKALKVKKSDLSISKKDEILELFEKYKIELLKIDNQIETTDTEINKMVFELYDLSEEEMNFINNSVKNDR